VRLLLQVIVNYAGSKGPAEEVVAQIKAMGGESDAIAVQVMEAQHPGSQTAACPLAASRQRSTAVCAKCCTHKKVHI
jgi:hypothetical protein